MTAIAYDAEMPSVPSLVIGRAVQIHRENRGWTQAAFARRLAAVGLRWGQPQVAYFERGRRVDVTLSEAVLLAMALGVRLADLLGGPDSIALGTSGDLAQGRYVEVPWGKVRAVLAGEEAEGPDLRTEPPPYQAIEEHFGRALGLLPGEVKALAQDEWHRSIEEEQEARTSANDPYAGLDWLRAELSDAVARRYGLPTLRDSLTVPKPSE